MTPPYNYTHQQMPASLPLSEKTEAGKGGVQSEQKERKDTSLSALSKKVDDPAQWDEAWFANYE